MSADGKVPPPGPPATGASTERDPAPVIAPGDGAGASSRGASGTPGASEAKGAATRPSSEAAPDDEGGFWSRWRDRRRRRRQAPPLPKKDRPETIEGQVADIYERFVSRTNAEVTGLWEMLGSRRRLMWVNFLAGLSRGIGFFLGVTLVGGLVIGGTALVLDTTAEILGWKDVTFASLVQSMYGKFQEVKKVIDSMEGEVEEPGPDPGSIQAPTLRSPFDDAFPTSDYPFEDGPLPGRPPPSKPPGLDGGPR